MEKTPQEMTRDELITEIANIDQIAKQNSFKYEKHQRGDFPDAKWERFVESQNEMFAYRDELEEELAKREIEPEIIDAPDLTGEQESESD